MHYTDQAKENTQEGGLHALTGDEQSQQIAHKRGKIEPRLEKTTMISTKIPRVYERGQILVRRCGHHFISAV